MKGGSELEEAIKETFEHRNKIEQELMLREHELKLKTLDQSIHILSHQINDVENEITELKLLVNEMKSSNKILMNLASVVIAAIATQIVAVLFN